MSSPQRVHHANKIRRWLGIVRQPVVPYEREEIQWIIDLYGDAHRSSRKVNWTAEVKAFNERFAGRNLPGTFNNPRPARTKGSLMTQSHRIPEVGQITGLKVRGDRPFTPAKPTQGHKRDVSESASGKEQTKTQKPNTPEKGKGEGDGDDGDDEGDEDDEVKKE